MSSGSSMCDRLTIVRELAYPNFWVANLLTMLSSDHSVAFSSSHKTTNSKSESVDMFISSIRTVVRRQGHASYPLQIPSGFDIHRPDSCG